MDNQRLARMNRRGKYANVTKTNDTSSTKKETADINFTNENGTGAKHGDFINEVAEKIVDTFDTLMHAGSQLESCSKALACKVADFLDGPLTVRVKENQRLTT